jgi:hypothetical protein
MEGEGFLAIWSDIAPEHETDYLHWLSREHTAERVGVPGFLGVRVFRARTDAARRYFILYQLQDSAVVKSEAYLARLNAPTAWSQRIMPRLKNFVRGGGRVIAEAGLGHGSVISPLVFSAHDKGGLKGQLQSLSVIDSIVASRLYEADDDATTIRTNEKAMRTNDASFALLLVIEGLRSDALQTALARLPPTGAADRPPMLYDQIFALDKLAVAHLETT